MCLYSCKEPMTAEKDLVCYKLLDKTGASYIQKFHYEPDKLNVTRLSFGDIYSNLPHWDDMAEYVYMREVAPKGKWKVIISGFHSAKRLERYCESVVPNGIIGKFIIPKGSIYYTDESGLVVSDKIIFKGIAVDFSDEEFNGKTIHKFTDRYGITHNINDVNDMEFLNSWEN